MSLLRTIHKGDAVALKELLSHLASRSVALDADLMKSVASIIEEVRVRGDEALVDYTSRFDHVDLKQSELRINADELHRLAETTDQRVIAALREAITNVRTFHERQVEGSWTI